MSVLIKSLFSNSSKWIDRFFNSLDKLDYPRDKLRFAFLEGGSRDNTWDRLKHFGDTHQNVSLSNMDVSDVSKRFERLALLRNKLIYENLKDADYVFSVDSDIVYFPPETLKALINDNVDIVAPYVFIEGTSQFYDTLAFRCRGQNFSHKFPYRPILPGKKVGDMSKVVSGLTKRLRTMDPSARWSEEGRLTALKYLSRFSEVTYLSGLHEALRGADKERWREEAVLKYAANQSMFEVDSVGTCYLVKRRVYEGNVVYKGGDSEQVTFCNNARESGFRVWVDPSIIVHHVNLESQGEKWH